MTDFASFKHGGVTFPLPDQDSGIGGLAATLLRDCDPAVFYMLEFYAAIIETHIGARLIAEAVGAGAEDITAAVREQLPMNPEPYLTQEHLKFPLLAVARKGTIFEYMGQRKLSVDTLEVSYVLPPMTGTEAEALTPVLKAITAIIDSRTELGFDTSYTPSTPTGTPGEVVWKADRAGLSRVEVTGAIYGGFQPIPDVYFPAVVLTVLVKERTEAVVSELQEMNGVDAAVDHTTEAAGDQSTIADVYNFATAPAPTLDGPLSPATGSKAGNTPVTIPGSGFVVGRRYRCIFAGADASNVTAVSTTSLTCVTPQVSAYPTAAADVYVIDQDEQLSNTLTTAFTFTSP